MAKEVYGTYEFEGHLLVSVVDDLVYLPQRGSGIRKYTDCSDITLSVTNFFTMLESVLLKVITVIKIFQEGY